MKEKLGKRHLIVLIAICGMVASSVGLVQNVAGLFFDPVADGLNIGRGPVAFTLTIYVLLSACGSLIFNKLSQKVSVLLIVRTAAIMLILGTLLSGLAANIFTIYLYSIIRGIGGGFIHLVVASLFINNWFEKRNALMASIAMACSGAAGAICSPILSSIISTHGYQIGYFVNAAIMFVLLIPILFFRVSYTPEEQGLKPYGYEEIRASKTISGEDHDSSGNLLFILIMTYANICGFMTCVPQFFPGHAANLHYSEAIGSLMLSLSMIANIFGKVAFGQLADTIGSKKAIFITTAIAIVGTACLLFNLNMYIGAFLYGFVFANATVGLTSLTREVFGKREYIRKYPVISFVSTIVNAFGSPVAGFIYDASGSYTPVFVLCLIFLIMILIDNYFVVKVSKKA